MKKLWGTLILTGLLMGAARAGTYECFSDGLDNTNQKLTIDFNKTDKPGNNFVKAKLESPELEVTAIFTGEGSIFDKSYQLKDQNSKGAELQFSSVIKHGGRCGRCSPISETLYYAKLNTELNEMDFQCFPKF